MVACSDLVVDPSMKKEEERERVREREEREIQSDERPIKILDGPFNVFYFGCSSNANVLQVKNSHHLCY